MALYLGYVRVIWFDCIAPTGDLNRLNIINRSEQSGAPYHSIASQSRRWAFDRHKRTSSALLSFWFTPKLTIDSHLEFYEKYSGRRALRPSRYFTIQKNHVLPIDECCVWWFGGDESYLGVCFHNLLEHDNHKHSKSWICSALQPGLVHLPSFPFER